MKTCYIFGALPVSRMPKLPEKGDFIIAADKGIETLEKRGMEPDIIIGDFDSLGYIPERENKIVLPERKDDTDIAYAINYALGKGCDRFCVYGAIGGLLDHTLANIQLSAYLSKKGLFNEFFGEEFTISCLTNGKMKLEKAEKGRFSMFALEKATGVSLKGLSYTADNREFDQFYPIGVSNEFVGEEAEIEVESGTLLLLWEGDICIKEYNSRQKKEDSPC